MQHYMVSWVACSKICQSSFVQKPIKQQVCIQLFNMRHNKHVHGKQCQQLQKIW